MGSKTVLFVAQVMMLHPEYLLQSDWLGAFLNVHRIFITETCKEKSGAQKKLTLKLVWDYDIFNLKSRFTLPKNEHSTWQEAGPQKKPHLPTPLFQVLLLMEEILHHLTCMKHCRLDIYHINWWTPDFVHQQYVGFKEGQLLRHGPK